jgi:hypothetical protein
MMLNTKTIITGLLSRRLTRLPSSWRHLISCLVTSLKLHVSLQIPYFLLTCFDLSMTKKKLHWLRVRKTKIGFPWHQIMRWPRCILGTYRKGQVKRRRNVKLWRSSKSLRIFISSIPAMTASTESWCPSLLHKNNPPWIQLTKTGN